MHAPREGLFVRQRGRGSQEADPDSVLEGRLSSLAGWIIVRHERLSILANIVKGEAAG